MVVMIDKKKKQVTQSDSEESAQFKLV